MCIQNKRKVQLISNFSKLMSISKFKGFLHYQNHKSFYKSIFKELFKPPPPIFKLSGLKL